MVRYFHQGSKLSVLFYSTTRNEAFHNQLKGFFRNVFQQTGRNAQMICKVATFAKLVVGVMARETTTSQQHEHQLLQVVAQTWTSCGIVVNPRLAQRAVANASVNVELLPPGVNLPRKRPASRDTRAVKKRPAMA